MKSTWWSKKGTSNHDAQSSSIYESVPPTDDYWVRDILRSTAWMLGRAQVYLKLLSITSLREADLLDIDESDKIRRLMYTMDDLRWLWMMRLAEDHIDVQSWAEAPPPWWFRPRTTPRYEQCRDTNHMEIWTTSAALHGRIGCRLSLGVERRRNWGPRLGSGGNGSIEFRNLGSEESNQSSVPFFFSSLFCTSRLDWISARDQWRQHGVWTTLGSQPCGGGVSPRAGPTKRLPYGAS